VLRQNEAQGLISRYNVLKDQANPDYTGPLGINIFLGFLQEDSDIPAKKRAEMGLKILKNKLGFSPDKVNLNPPPDQDEQIEINNFLAFAETQDAKETKEVRDLLGKKL
jgi:hypothetical protein